MRAISYEEALEFRELSGVPPTWDETIPPPPLDRIEFTRRILEAAEEAGFEFFVWTSQISYEDPKDKWSVFQKIIHQHTYRQSFHGIPKVGWSGWSNGVHSIDERTLKWGEYIEQLEEDYYRPWMTSWLFGFCEGSEDRIIAQLKEDLSQQMVGYYRGDPDTDTPKYPNADKISGNDIIARFIPKEDGWKLEISLRRDFCIDFPLVENGYLGMRGEWMLIIPLFIAGLGLLGAILGAIWGWYSGWLLLLILPVLAVLCVLFELTIVSWSRRCWIDKKMTFRELAARIRKIKANEWDVLQNKYGAV